VSGTRTRTICRKIHHVGPKARCRLPVCAPAVPEEGSALVQSNAGCKKNLPLTLPELILNALQLPALQVISDDTTCRCTHACECPDHCSTKIHCATGQIKVVMSAPPRSAQIFRLIGWHKLFLGRRQDRTGTKSSYQNTRPVPGRCRKTLSNPRPMA